jgi:predicted dehydrogenase
MSNIKTVAVVGLGIGRAHLEEGYANHPDKFRVLAACDLNEDRLHKVADEFGIPRRTTSFAEVLAMDDVDIVDICTPPGIHLEQILAALAAGKEVIAEKPLVGSLADTDKVIAAAATAKGRVMPIFQYRWGTGYQKAKRIVDLGLAGKPYLISAETHWRRDADYYAVDWRGRYSVELGGATLSQAIHLHDMVQELMGPIASLSAHFATRVNPIEVEDCAAVSIRFENGALGTLSATLGSANEISRIRVMFEHVTIESALEPYAPGNDPWIIIPRTEAAKARIDAALDGFEPVHPRFRGQLEAYHAALVSGGELPVTLADARRSLELITALNHSAETELPQSWPIGPDHPKYAGWRPAKGPKGSLAVKEQ